MIRKPGEVVGIGFVARSPEGGYPEVVEELEAKGRATEAFLDFANLVNWLRDAGADPNYLSAMVDRLQKRHRSLSGPFR